MLGQGVRGDPRWVRVGYMQQWSFNVQRELPGQLQIEAGYVGSRSRRNERARPLNLIDPATGERPDARFSQILFAESSGSAGLCRSWWP